MSKKEKSTADITKNAKSSRDAKIEMMHEKNWFSKTDRSQKTQLSKERTHISREQSRIFQDIGEELFTKLTDDVLSGKLQNYKSGKDLFRHILHLTDSNFICCGKINKTFDKYVEHRIQNCNKIVELEIENNASNIRGSLQSGEQDAISLSMMAKYIRKDGSASNSSEEEDEQIKTFSKNGKKYLSCTIKNCRKRFKSINGLKYHSKHGHRNPNDVVKSFRCNVAGCKKKYKNHNGLKYHNEHGHKKIDDE